MLAAGEFFGCLRATSLLVFILSGRNLTLFRLVRAADLADGFRAGCLLSLHPRASECGDDALSFRQWLDIE